MFEPDKAAQPVTREGDWHTPSANERQVGGDHYKKHGTTGEQHWDRAARLGLDYFQAQATKYIERCWDKNGVQDLEKARHFIDKYIELSRVAGRLGKLETVAVLNKNAANPSLAVSRELKWLLRNHIVTEDGTIKINGTLYVCLRGKPSDFTFEGVYGDGRTRWRCTTCREWFYTMRGLLPHASHAQPCTKAPQPATSEAQPPVT